MEARLIIDGAGDGGWNMAVDEALLLSAARQNVATLRFYGWSVPTVTLGYFQSYSDGDLHRSSANCPRIRRASGGGAIVHDRELTYSWTMPWDMLRAEKATVWYDRFHDTMRTVLAEWGLQAQTSPSLPHRPEPYLCFQRRASGDLLVEGHKVCGSAQRRHQRSFLQHGSLLLSHSSAAPELPGICDLHGTTIEPHNVHEKWIKALSLSAGIDWKKSPLTVTEVVLANELADRFRSEQWNTKR